MIECIIVLGLLCMVAAVAMGILYMALDTMLCGNGNNANVIGCKEFHALTDVLAIATLLFCVFSYFGCEFLCWLLAVRKEWKVWNENTSRKKLRIMFVQMWISEMKSIFIILFLWIYHTYNPNSKTGDGIAEFVLIKYPSTARLMCLLVGVSWFFDLYLLVVLEAAQKHTPDTPTNKRRRCCCCCCEDDEDEDAVSQKEQRQKQREYAQWFFQVHMRWYHPWDKPEEEAIGAVEDVLAGEHVEFIPCVRNWNKSSIEEYLILFTIFHVGLVTYNLILTNWFGGVDNNDFLEVYSMFPLGFFLGEKLMYIYTGFIPWWSEFLVMKGEEDHAGWVAWMGLVINVIDFLMVFFSIADDCLQLTNFPLSWVLALMVIDQVFDCIAIGKKGLGKYGVFGNSSSARLLA